jgi:hypothetical protein
MLLFAKYSQVLLKCTSNKKKENCIGSWGELLIVSSFQGTTSLHIYKYLVQPTTVISW